jgi:hypothetical protein
MKLSGSAGVVRNGVAVEPNIGDAVLKGDVAQTGERTMLSYLAKPLSDQLMRAFRER